MLIVSFCDVRMEQRVALLIHAERLCHGTIPRAAAPAERLNWAGWFGSYMFFFFPDLGRKRCISHEVLPFSSHIGPISILTLLPPSCACLSPSSQISLFWV